MVNGTASLIRRFSLKPCEWADKRAKQDLGKRAKQDPENSLTVLRKCITQSKKKKKQFSKLTLETQAGS